MFPTPAAAPAYSGEQPLGVYAVLPAAGVALSPTGEEIRTIFVTGFPANVHERELHNLVCFLPGYEASQVSWRVLDLLVHARTSASLAAMPGDAASGKCGSHIRVPLGLAAVIRAFAIAVGIRLPAGGSSDAAPVQALKGGRSRAVCEAGSEGFRVLSGRRGLLLAPGV